MLLLLYLALQRFSDKAHDNMKENPLELCHSSFNTDIMQITYEIESLQESRNDIHYV